MLPSLPTSSPKPTEASGFDPSALISIGLDVVSGLITANKAKQDQNALANRIKRLSEAQQQELELKVKSVEGEVNRMQTLFKTLAVYENQQTLDLYNKKQTTKKIILASGFGLLIAIIVLVKLKQHE